MNNLAFMNVTSFMVLCMVLCSYTNRVSLWSTSIQMSLHVDVVVSIVNFLFQAATRLLNVLSYTQMRKIEVELAGICLSSQ